jgi:hypothetical protein
MWLDNSISNHELLQCGYKISRRDSENKRGGGVLLAVKIQWKPSRLNLHPQLWNCYNLFIQKRFSMYMVSSS